MRQPAKEAILRKFFEDQEVYDEVQEFVFAHLDQLGLQYMYEKKDVLGIADAKIVLENVFKQFEDLFGEKEKLKKPTNESR